MINVRKGCFETNSSSMHSLAIWKEAKPYSDWNLILGGCDEQGVFDLFRYVLSAEDASFERYPFRILKTPIEKLQYLVGYYYRDGRWRDNRVRRQLEKIVKSHVPGCRKIKWYTLDWNGNRRYMQTAYNNDSGEFPVHFLQRKGISLEDFIFNPKYTIQVDGDEYQTFAGMFEYNAINTDNIADISSGIEYWTGDYIEVYIDSLLDQQYLNSTATDLEKVNNIWIYEFESAGEDAWKLAADILSKYKDEKTFKIGAITNNTWAKKYLPWVKEKLYE